MVRFLGSSVLLSSMLFVRPNNTGNYSRMADRQTDSRTKRQTYILVIWWALYVCYWWSRWGRTTQKFNRIMDIRSDRQPDWHKDGRTDRQTHRRTDGHTLFFVITVLFSLMLSVRPYNTGNYSRMMDRQTYWQTAGQTDRQTYLFSGEHCMCAIDDLWEVEQHW